MNKTNVYEVCQFSEKYYENDVQEDKNRVHSFGILNFLDLIFLLVVMQKLDGFFFEIGL